MFRGQDAWRRHPLLAGNWKQPFPHLGTAIAIFTVYIAAETAFLYCTGAFANLKNVVQYVTVK